MRPQPRLSARLLEAVYDPEDVYTEALAVVLGAADEAGRRGLADPSGPVTGAVTG